MWAIRSPDLFCTRPVAIACTILYHVKNWIIQNLTLNSGAQRVTCESRKLSDLCEDAAGVMTTFVFKYQVIFSCRRFIGEQHSWSGSQRIVKQGVVWPAGLLSVRNQEYLHYTIAQHLWEKFSSSMGEWKIGNHHIRAYLSPIQHKNLTPYRFVVVQVFFHEDPSRKRWRILLSK